MCKSYIRNLPLHPVGGKVSVSDPEYFKLLDELAAVRHAALELHGVIQEFKALPGSGMANEMFKIADRYYPRIKP